MGNRCMIVPKGDENIAVYLHWNGGVDSVTAFLKYCKLKRYEDFGGDQAHGYGIARFVQVVSNYFGGGLSIGIVSIPEDLQKQAEWLDNGIYIIDGWEISNRLIGYNRCREGYDLTKMLIDIDTKQPVSEQLGKGFIQAQEVLSKDLQIGDKIYFFDPLYYKYTLETIKGFEKCYGRQENVPFVDKYPNHTDINPNNFALEKVYRVRTTD